MSIAANLSSVNQRISAACQKYSRHSSNSVQLLAVSKTKPATMIQSAFDNGQTKFGENYLQEAISKINQLANLSLEWHFIGSVQSNKCKIIANNFTWVHTVANLKTAQAINNYALQPINICIQINISLEASKSGCNLNELLGLATKVSQLPKLKLRGLMALPQPSNNFAHQLAEFTKVKVAFDELIAQGFELDTLSIGMSNDLEAAIAAGSTMLRIGSDIFGIRN